MTRRLGYHEPGPLAAVLASHCCWPKCERKVTPDVLSPLCKDHLIKAWRIVHETGVHVVMGFAGRLPPPAPERPREGEFVYFVRFRDRVKIGYTSSLASRLTALPHDEVLHVQPGTRKDEKRCHAAFAHLRENGEWFRAESDLLAFVEGLRVAA